MSSARQTDGPVLSRTANSPPDASDGEGSFRLAVVMYSVSKF